MPNVTLRLTDEQHATLVAAAEDNHRSMQGEIIHRLFPPRLQAVFVDVEDHFKPDPKPARAEKKGRR
jgi:hypothetical protein